ncbi:MAG: gluconate 2-dehydrogenase subunit 3 family protein [Chthoniobacteraceae bacterium]|nr:gluconate 2-dehydrogenase subunit 3 family protein [Chthoniobacteraceae bacterium]MDB6175813.1 gluconate 2-dehydrogenase subunit 3 family protein [Chthoniobacteraceae bacterium]
MNLSSPRSVSRRDAVKWILGAAATVSALDFEAFGLPGLPTGIGTDPNLHKKIIPWERILTAEEMKTVTALCDVIIPADERSPSASAVGVPDFVNEWVSAPYPQQVGDREAIRAGLAWIEKESAARFNKSFSELAEAEKQQICDDICSAARAKPEHKKGAEFFSRMRNLVAGGFYTTPEGWKDLGYIGNTPMAEFKGPPPEVLKHLGLA